MKKLNIIGVVRYKDGKFGNINCTYDLDTTGTWGKVNKQINDHVSNFMAKPFFLLLSSTEQEIISVTHCIY